jgi:iron complex outermembrane receptor protein
MKHGIGREIQTTSDSMGGPFGKQGLALGAMAFAGSVYAAENASPQGGAAAEGLEEVVVTGIRASLQRSLDIKLDAVGVVDAISAEDIGKFPDSNLAAALQRVPGVSISRGTTSMGGVPTSTGDATAITVRGFGPAFNETLIDGRVAASVSGFGNTLSRGFDFSSLGADFVNEVHILKTPDATLSSGAIGATINIKYPKPLDRPGMRLAASGSMSYSPDAEEERPNGGILFSNTFADDTFGILANAVYSEHEVLANHVNVQGWQGVQLAPSQLAGAGPGASTTPSEKAWFIQSWGMYQERTVDKRIDGRLVLQWRPSDVLLITVNDDFSEDKLRQEQFGMSLWFNAGNLTEVTRNADGTITNFVQNNSPTDFHSQVNGSVIRNNSLGANVAWTVSDNFTAEFDVAQSISKLNPDGELSSIDADVGYGPSGPGGTNGVNVGITGIGKDSLPYVTAYGPGGDTSRAFDTGLVGSHVMVMASARNEAKVDQFKLMGTWAEDQLTLRFGASFVQDTKDLSTFDTFTNNNWQAYAGYGPGSNNAGGVPLPASLFGRPVSTSGFIRGFSNNGNLPPQMLSYDPFAVRAYLQGLGNPQTQAIPGANTNCCTPPYDGTYDLALNPGSVQEIKERTYAPFVSLTQQSEIASMPLRIHLGARFETTDLTTTGLGQSPIALTVQPSDRTAFLVTYGPIANVTEKNRYRHLLPSLDLNLSVTDELKLRLDASRTLTRPPLNLITPVLNVPTTERVGALVATGGNPQLLPFLSDNLDLGAEWYYAPNSYASVGVFLKEVTNFIVGGTNRQTINGVIDPTTGELAQFNVTTQVNGPSAEVRGLEVAVQHMFGDTGFGLQANATVVDTNKPYDANDISVSGFAVTGLADSANLVAFYEKSGFHVRVAVNWRDEYLDHFGQQQNNSAFGTEPTFVNANTQIDFTTSYDFNERLSVYFEGLNLNESTFSTHGRFDDQILDVVDFGRRYTLGARMRL